MLQKLHRSSGIITLSLSVMLVSACSVKALRLSINGTVKLPERRKDVMSW